MVALQVEMRRSVPGRAGQEKQQQKQQQQQQQEQDHQHWAGP